MELAITALDVGTEIARRSLSGAATTVDERIDQVSAEIVHYPWPTVVVRPFVSAGAGVKLTDFVAAMILEGDLGIDPAVQLGGGLALPLQSGFSIRVAVRRFTSWHNRFPRYQTSLQHDLALTLSGQLHL